VVDPGIIPHSNQILLDADVTYLAYDSLLIVSFGGPECRDDVIPFLENVLRCKPVPRERMLEVAEHYYHFGGVSPINTQCRELIAALRIELDAAGISLPIYWGNRNWTPLLPDTLREMAQAGHRRTLAYFTSAYSSYSGCRQYRENIAAAQQIVGPTAPTVDKLRMFYNHPRFIAANVDRLRSAIQQLPESVRESAQILFTAHSIPMLMADNCHYVRQLTETCRLISEQLGWSAERWQLVYQSRSGRPQDPWLEPDILDAIRTRHAAHATGVVVAPIGFLSDHMEVLFDLDEEAKLLCESLGLPMARAATAGQHPEFITMIRELIEERLGLRAEKSAMGQYPANHDVCPQDCCLYPVPQRPVTQDATSRRGM